MEAVETGQREVDGHEVVGAGIEVVLELGAVLDRLDDHETDTQGEGSPHPQAELLEIPEPQGGPGEHHRHTGRDQHHGVERGQGHIENLVAVRPLCGAGPQQDQGREQRSEKHDLRSQEEPDAQLGVVEPGVGRASTV